MLSGRCIQLTDTSLVLRNLAGSHTVALSRSPTGISAGDLVQIRDGVARLLTPNRAPDRSLRWLDQTLSARRLAATRVRAQVEAGIREFFLGRDFFETRTPLLVPSPGMEPHIRPFRVAKEGDELYLPTSPEFAMKRLLVGGLERIFQISPAFRDEPVSKTHHPQFTMLEWYRAYAGYEDIMRDTEELLAHLARRISGKAVIRFGGREISVDPPWPRLRVRDLFLEHTGIDLTRSADAASLARECARLGLGCDPSRENWDDLFFKIWLNLIEPRLPADRAVLVTRYPASQAALSVIDRDPDGTAWARRFEVYAGGLELGNAFEELTDPVEQRSRFVKDMDLREKIYGPSFPRSPLDEEFLGALEEGLPPSGGIAVGVDRLVMLLADEPELQYTLWLP